MTVGELIDQLSKMDPELDVVIYEDTELGDKATVGSVELNDANGYWQPYWYDVRNGGLTPKRGAHVWLGV